MKKVLISLAVVIGLLGATSIASAALSTDHGPSYYGSNYDGNWANQYGYGYSNGSGTGGTGGSGYVGPGAGVQTNPKYNIPVTGVDESCIGKYRLVDGTEKITIWTRNILALNTFTGWTDDACKEVVVGATNYITGEYLHSTALAWARSANGPWTLLTVNEAVKTLPEIIGNLGQHGKISASGSVITFQKYSNVGGICDFVFKSLDSYPYLYGSWTLKVVNGPGVSGETCTRQINHGPDPNAPKPVAPVITTTTAPVNSTPVVNSNPVVVTTTTTAPKPVEPSPTTTTTTAPKPATTTTTQAPVTTTTTAPKPVTTTTTSPTYQAPANSYNATNRPPQGSGLIRCMLDEVDPATGSYWRHPQDSPVMWMTKDDCLNVVKSGATKYYSNNRDIRWLIVEDVYDSAGKATGSKISDQGWTRVSGIYQY